MMLLSKKALRKQVIRILTLGLIANVWQPVSAQGFTVDHNALVAFDDGIPQEWLERAKDLVVIHTGQSHGRQVPWGLMDIETEIDATFDVDIVTEGVPAATGALRIMRWLDGVGYLVDTDDYWEVTAEVGGIDIENVRNTLDLHAANGLRVDVILHTWSWDFFPGEYNSSRINEYLAALETLESEYPDTRFIYMTDTSDRTGSYGDSRWLSHEQIRKYALEHDKILFDFGELETWTPDLSRQTTYFSSALNTNVPVCAAEWECGGTGYVGQTGEGGSHINKAGATMKAKAFWVLLARIAGWDGASQNGPPTKPNPPTDLIAE